MYFEHYMHYSKSCFLHSLHFSCQFPCSPAHWITKVCLQALPEELQEDLRGKSQCHQLLLLKLVTPLACQRTGGCAQCRTSPQAEASWCCQETFIWHWDSCSDKLNTSGGNHQRDGQNEEQAPTTRASALFCVTAVSRPCLIILRYICLETQVSHIRWSNSIYTYFLSAFHT